MAAAGADTPRPRLRINFEVSVRRSRKWEVFATYGANERELALADAKKMERDGGVDGTKVTKETLHLETHRVDSAVIFRSASLERELAELAADRPKPPRSPAPSAAPKAPKAATPAAAKPAPKPAVTTRQVDDFSIIRAAPAIMAAFLFSCMVGAVLTVGSSYGLQAVAGMGVVLGRQGQLAILLGIFAITTAYSMFFLLRRIMKNAVTQHTVLVKAGHAKGPAPVADASEASDPVSNAADLAPPPPPTPRELQDMKLLAGAGQLAQAFTDHLLEHLGERLTPRDAGQRFALDVYVGGAIDTLAQSLGLSRDGFQKLLEDPLRRLDAPPEMIERFGSALEGYLAQPRVRDVYDRGRADMTRLLAGESDAIDPDAALQAWEAGPAPAPAELARPEPGFERPEPGFEPPEPEFEPPAPDPDAAAEQPGGKLVAVLYTDAILPPDVTPQRRGKKAVRRVFRAHSKIVRETLDELDGTEFEHDGDGILASFSVPSRAVEAAIMIRSRIVAADDGSMPRLDTRIGIDVGEPAYDDGELVGSAVELASHLCGRGAAGQILTSRLVRDLCPDQDRRFAHLGDEEFEGVSEAVGIFELVDPDGEPVADGSEIIEGAE